MFSRTASRLLAATRPVRWRGSDSKSRVEAEEEPRSSRSEAQSLRQEAGSFRAEKADRNDALEMLLNRREVQHMLSDAYCPYDRLDPVLVSALLRDDLENFLDRFKVSKEQFLADYRAARGLHTSTRENRAAFREKYHFDPLAVVYGEEEFVLPGEVEEKLTIKLTSVKPSLSQCASEYNWWDKRLNELLLHGYTAADYDELNRWLRSPKSFRAFMLHLYNVTSVVYRVAQGTSRIDPVAAERMLSPRYLPTWAEVDQAFRLDLPLPADWRWLPPTKGVEKARMIDDYNRDANGVYSNVSVATFVSHFNDQHTSFHPLKHHCKATWSILLPTQEMVENLAKYLVERAATYKALEVPILEVGAGTGRLAFHLNATKALQDAGVQVVATDAEPTPVQNVCQLAVPRAQKASFESFPVEKLAQEEAVEKYCPAIVLCAMMPQQNDFTRFWRSRGHVCEYILLGAADSPYSGKPWATWGVRWDENSPMQGAPPYALEGFKKLYVDDVSRYMIGQEDHRQCSGSNRCVSFRRVTLPEKMARLLVFHYGPAIAFVGFFVSMAYLTLPEE